MSKTFLFRTIALVALAGTAACASTRAQEFASDALAAPGVAYDAARRAAGPPQFNAVATPERLTGGGERTMPQPALVAYEAGAPNSLWRTGSRSFFNDQRASRIGDIITVNIEIDDRAELSNSSDRQRESSTSAGLSNFFGLERSSGQLLNNACDAENRIVAPAGSENRGATANIADRARSIARKKSSSPSPRSLSTGCPTAIWSSRGARKSASTANCAN